jgi:hypothetical protein
MEPPYWFWLKDDLGPADATLPSALRIWSK